MKRKALGKVIHAKPGVIIGKNGITSSILKEIERQFEKKRVIKIKILSPEALSSADFDDLAKRTKSKIRDVRGKTCILQLVKTKSHNLVQNS